MPVRYATSAIDSAYAAPPLLSPSAWFMRHIFLIGACRKTSTRVPARCQGSCKGAQMSTLETSIDVDVDVRTAYNQWTQFEEFPQFMEGVESIRQLDDTLLHWVAEIAGVRR